MTDERPPCDSEIIGRDGLPLDFRCNLPAGHLGGHAELADIMPALRKMQDECDRLTAKDGGEK